LRELQLQLQTELKGVVLTPPPMLCICVTLVECSPIEAEIKLMEKLKGSPRFPVWLRFRRV